MKIEEKNDKIKDILHRFSTNKSKMNLTCTIETNHDTSKDFSHHPLSKTSLFGIIFLTACVVLTCGLCFGWFGVISYRRFEQRRMKHKLQKALARSVQQLLDRSPIILFKSNTTNHDNTDDDPICAVCLELFVDNEKIRKLSKIKEILYMHKMPPFLFLFEVCSHYFHVECIDPWLLSRQSCPLCNRNILAETVPSISFHVTAANDEPNNQESRSINSAIVIHNNSIIEPQNSNL